MSIALLLALTVQDPQTPATGAATQARIPKPFVVVSLDLANRQADAPGKNPLGDKMVMSGSIAPDGANLSRIVEPNAPPVSAGEWRKRLAHGGRPFEVDATPRVDTTQELAPGLSWSDFHAYFATRTHSLDLHISATPGARQGFPRPEFECIVRSLRVLLLSRGWREDYPEAIAAPMTAAAMLGVAQKEWREGHRKEHAADWATWFASAECLHDQKAPLAEQTAAYDKALALAGKVASPDAKTRFALAMLYECKSLALYDAKRFADTIPLLENALAVVEELGHLERGGVAYNLACSHALCKHEAPALAALAKAIAAAPRYRELATRDSDFAALAKSSGFKKLTAPPAESGSRGG